MTTQLTVTQLFTPAPSGVGNAGTVPSAPASGSWLTKEYQIATLVQLPTTSWQSGAPERSILAINAVCLSQDDALISMMAQGAFLSSAATGTVTYQTLQQSQLVTVTVPVTPDPSIPSQNPTGAPGWLDLLGQNVYDTDRLSASFAKGPLALANISGSTVGPFAQGAYHVANVNGATYSNADGTLTVPSSAIAGTGGVVTAVSVGVTATVIQTQSAHGLSVGQTVYIKITAASGISGLDGVFGLVTSATTNTFAVAVGSSGTYTSGGTVYLCTVVTMTADVIGTGGAAAPGTVQTTVTQNAGVYCSNVTPWSGANWESNQAYASRCSLALAAASPNGPSQAYVYFALTAAEILGDATPAYVFTNGPMISANEFANPQTGLVTTVVASTTPVSTTLAAAVTPGCAQNPVSGVTNAMPAVFTCSNPTGIPVGQTATVTITGVEGAAALVAAVNGTFLGTYVSPTTFSIPVDSTSLGAYSAGGSVEAGDLGAVDNLLQQNVVPDGIVAITVSALALPIAVVATVTVPQAYVATYRLAAPIALQAYLGSLPIGGVFSPTETVPVSYEEVVGALLAAGILTLGTPTYVRGTPVVTVNGGTSDVAFPTNQYQALIGATTINVVGV